MFAPHTNRASQSLIAEVQRCDRRRLAPAGARAPALEQRPDRPAEHVVAGRPRGAGEHRRQPSGRGEHVVVDEHDQLRARGGDAGVAGGVQAARLRKRDERAPWRCRPLAVAASGPSLTTITSALAARAWGMIDPSVTAR